MKKKLISLSEKFIKKIYSFLISDGISKVLLARQFIPITKQEVQRLNTNFILHLLSKENNETNFNNLSITNFFKNDLLYTYNPYKYKEDKKIYFVLVTEIDFNPFEIKDILKSITSYISSQIKNENEDLTINQIIVKRSYEIILALDDIINPIIGNEGLTQSQIYQNVKMVSREEEYFNIKLKEKIENAHIKFIKGMEEIERLKYEKNYNPNSISKEDLEKKDKELIESQKIIEEIANERENSLLGEEAFRHILNSTINRRALNLRRRIINGLNNTTNEEAQNFSNFVNACENILQNMLLNEMQNQNEIEDAGDINYTYIVTPINIISLHNTQNDN